MIPKRLSRKVIHESPWVSLFLDKIQYSNGHILDDMHLVHFDHEAVGIVVQNEKGDVLLIKSPRYHTQSVEWEIPAGQIDDGEDPVDAAKRETLEETGYSIDDVKLIYRFNPSNGISDQTFHICKCKTTIFCKESEPDPLEVSELKWVSKEEIRRMIQNNEINCGFSLVGLMLVLFCGF